MKIEREAQKAQTSRRVGDGQADKCPTYEGSMLDTPSKAKISTGSTPHLS